MYVCREIEAFEVRTDILKTALTVYMAVTTLTPPT